MSTMYVLMPGIGTYKEDYKDNRSRELPGSPVVRTPPFHC